MYKLDKNFSYTIIKYIANVALFEIWNLKEML